MYFDTPIACWLQPISHTRLPWKRSSVSVCLSQITQQFNWAAFLMSPIKPIFGNDVKKKCISPLFSVRDTLYPALYYVACSLFRVCHSLFPKACCSRWVYPDSESNLGKNEHFSGGHLCTHDGRVMHQNRAVVLLFFW